MSGIGAKRAALDASAATYQMLQLDGRWRFTRGSLDDLERELDGLRELLTQMKCAERGGKHDFDEFWFMVSRIAVSCMAAYLSGKLDTMEVDDD